MSPELGNVVAMARRLLETPKDQPGLLDDRLNDLDVALWEYDRADEDDERPDLNREGDPAFNGAFDKW